MVYRAHARHAANTRKARSETREEISHRGTVHVSLAIPSETRRDKAIFSLLVNFVDLQVLSAANKAKLIMMSHFCEQNFLLVLAPRLPCV